MEEILSVAEAKMLRGDGLILRKLWRITGRTWIRSVAASSHSWYQGRHPTLAGCQGRLPACCLGLRAGPGSGRPGASWPGGCGTAEILFQTSWLFGTEFCIQFPVVPKLVRFNLTRGCLLQLWQQLKMLGIRSDQVCAWKFEAKYPFLFAPSSI